MKEYAAWRRDTEAVEDLGVEQRQEDHLLERLHVALQSAHFAPVDTAINRHWLHVASACHPTRIEAASTGISAAATATLA